jgi:hypothetical protein
MDGRRRQVEAPRQLSVGDADMPTAAGAISITHTIPHISHKRVWDICRLHRVHSENLCFLSANSAPPPRAPCPALNVQPASCASAHTAHSQSARGGGCSRGLSGRALRLHDALRHQQVEGVGAGAAAVADHQDARPGWPSSSTAVRPIMRRTGVGVADLRHQQPGLPLAGLETQIFQRARGELGVGLVKDHIIVLFRRGCP